MEWISVKEKLPEKGQHVLASQVAKEFKRRIIAIWTGADWVHSIWEMGNHTVLKGIVTHWQPLPEPPESKE